MNGFSCLIGPVHSVCLLCLALQAHLKSQSTRSIHPSGIVEEGKFLTSCARRSLSQSNRSDPKQVICLPLVGQRVLIIGRTRGGKPLTMPPNPSTFIQQGSCQVEARQIICFQVFGHKGTCATSAWLLYGTPDIVIARILHMQDYTTFETTEVVGLTLFFFAYFSLFSLFITISLLPPRWQTRSETLCGSVLTFSIAWNQLRS